MDLLRRLELVETRFLDKVLTLKFFDRKQTSHPSRGWEVFLYPSTLENEDQGAGR